MYNFSFQIPTTIHFGRGTISFLTELKDYGKKVLLVYGGGSIKKNGIYDKAMKISKSYPMAYYNKGLTYFAMKDYDNALKNFDTALELKKDYVSALFNKGSVFIEMKRYDEAIEIFHQCQQ